MLTHKSFWRLGKVLLCLILSLLCILSSSACGQLWSENGNETESIPTTVESESETEIPPEISKYVIIVPEGASSTVYSAATYVQNLILTTLGCSIEIKDDYISWADTPCEYEILIGDVKRDESKAMTGLRLKDFVISTDDKKWIIKGGDDSSTSAAATYFAANCLDMLDECPEGYRYYSDGNYKVKTMTICGKDVSEYIIVYPNNAPVCEKYATIIQAKISALCGTVIPIYKESAAPESEGVISFGHTSTSICNFTNLGYDSHEIAADEGNLSFTGGCQNAYYTALDKFEKLLVQKENLTLTTEDLKTRFDQVSREEYIANPDLFVPIWQRNYSAGSVPTFEEKISALCTPKTSTLLTMAHRGEHDYYPDNSVEALISAYRAGAYIVELDARYTADGVLVMMHDSTLTRMTNYELLKGKTVNGIELPTSPEISDWTYEQLMQLNLKSGSGGNSAQITEFKIATLEDMLKAAKNKILISVENKTLNSRYLEDVLTIMKKTDSCRSFLLGSSGGMSVNDCVEWQSRIKNETGNAPIILARSGSSAFKSTTDYLRENAVGDYAILLGSYRLKDKVSLATALNNVTPSINVGGWTLTEDVDAPSTVESWQEMYDLGFRIIMVNNIFDLLKFANKLKT